METGKEVVKISLNNIIPNRFQPRISFDEEALNELANSIKMYGILQPLILRPLGDKYEIIAGERRYKAATQAGLTEVPAILVNLDDQTSAELAIIENIQRKDLTAIEEAKSYKKLIDLGNYTQDQLANKMGKSQSSIANKLRLLSLIPEAQDALMNNLISERHARSLLQLKDDPAKQREVLNKVTTERLTVKDTDALIKTMMGGNTMNDDLISQPVQAPVTPTQPNNGIPDLYSNAPTPEPTPSFNDYLNQTTPVPPTNNEPPIQTPQFDIPNLNTDTFNLSDISNPDLNIPTTPQNNSFLNETQPILDSQPTIPSTPQFDLPNFDSILQTDTPPVVPTPNGPVPESPLNSVPTPPTNDYSSELNDEPTALAFSKPIVTTDEPTPPPKTMDMTNAKNETQKTIKILEFLGYKVTSHEEDLPDTYKVTIEIKKDAI